MSETSQNVSDGKDMFGNVRCIFGEWSKRKQNFSADGKENENEKHIQEHQKMSKWKMEKK